MKIKQVSELFLDGGLLFIFFRVEFNILLIFDYCSGNQKLFLRSEKWFGISVDGEKVPYKRKQNLC